MHVVPVICLLAFSACAETGTALPVNGRSKVPAADDTCGAAMYRALIGQDISMFDAAGRPGPVRVIRPGQPVTSDYNPERLNVLLDGNNRIQAVRCG